MNRAENIWEKVLDVLQEHVNEQTYRTWFRETKLIEKEEQSLTIHVPTHFIAQYLNSNYKTMVSEICYTLFDNKYNVNFTNRETGEIKPVLSSYMTLKSESRQSNDIPRLNPNYQFKDFVIGSNNRFAQSAAFAVAESPGTTYNPLFIYGKSGMGKTHLMQAIGHMVLDLHEYKRVYYITTEQFTNEMIDSIRSNAMDKFRNKFRYFDVLLIDDIQFLSSKEGTQEEFFHTFNALYETKKQIIVTSDRLPREIPDLEQRLVSRFEWGLMTDLKQPNFETRVAILKKKAERDNINLPEEVINYIAENITSNVRALEGSLVKIQAWTGYKGIDSDGIDIELIKDILKDLFSEKKSRITLDLICNKVCNNFNINSNSIFLKTRKSEIAQPRQIAMYLSNLYIPSLTLKTIANYYKLKDHTTVLHAIKSIKTKIEIDNDLKYQVQSLMDQLKQ
ncbi:MAG: chromosomal replication initiator protein DnaA [Candidatus Cloacimonetes bacterium]|nr:chromosomal replication initiator protein DnaA [Candidatus Cloacimonadota bacterium]